MKKFLCLLSAFILAFSVTACSGNVSEQITEISENNTETAETSSVTTEETSASETSLSAETSAVSENSSDTAAETRQEDSVFQMSLEEYNEYEREYLEDNREMLSVILESAVTGEKPVLKTEYYEMELPALVGVKLDSFEVSDESFDSASRRYEVTVRLNVTESENEFIPVGVDEYVFIRILDEGRQFLPLRRKGELSENALLPHGGDSVSAAGKFCNDFTAYFSGMFPGETITDFSKPDISLGFDTVFYAMMNVHWYQPDADPDSDFDMSYETFDKALEELYGFTADSIDTKSMGYYNEETDTVSIPGRGISWVYGYLTEESRDEENGLVTVTIDYFSDEFFFDRAATYRYTVGKNENGSFTMLKMERLFSSDKSILGGCV